MGQGCDVPYPDLGDSNLVGVSVHYTIIGHHSSRKLVPPSEVLSQQWWLKSTWKLVRSADSQAYPCILTRSPGHLRHSGRSANVGFAPGAVQVKSPSLGSQNSLSFRRLERREGARGLLFQGEDPIHLILSDLSFYEFSSLHLTHEIGQLQLEMAR